MNRITRASDFRTIVRSGRRMGGPHSVVYVVKSSSDQPSRFGFIVSKAVGNSVVRHTMTRRLRAICFGIVDSSLGTDVIIRALPGSPEVDWSTLQSEVTTAIAKGVAPR